MGVQIDIHDELRRACGDGNVDEVRRLLTNPNADPTFERQCPPTFSPFAVACQNGRLDVVRLLLQDDRVDPPAQQYFALRLASFHGHVDVLDELLRDARVDHRILLAALPHFERTWRDNIDVTPLIRARMNHMSYTCPAFNPLWWCELLCERINSWCGA